MYNITSDDNANKLHLLVGVLLLAVFRCNFAGLGHRPNAPTATCRFESGRQGSEFVISPPTIQQIGYPRTICPSIGLPKHRFSVVKPMVQDMFSLFGNGNVFGLGSQTTANTHPTYFDSLSKSFKLWAIGMDIPPCARHHSVEHAHGKSCPMGSLGSKTSLQDWPHKDTNMCE